ncbi:hypothetical protein ACH4ZU_07165 [Streptomyces sp. NPDC020472]|uniref:hypothetical protein n=1 Tax=Streptomyces sp. NPDC020472 TaxID=3365075 RepID=UPI0037A75F6A
MKLMVSRMTDKRTLFFGEADSYTVMTRGVAAQDLLAKLRTSALLYDHVILAAAYFWQSEQLRHVLPYVTELIGTGEILPSIRSPWVTRDVIDYFDKRIEDTAGLVGTPIFGIEALASEIARPEQRPVAEQLATIGTLVHLDTGSVEDTFRGLWLTDSSNVRDPYSVHNAVLETAGGHDGVGDLLRGIGAIAHQAFFSRSVVAQELYGMNLPPALTRVLIDRASELYLRSNASACGSEQLVTTRWAGSGGPSVGPLASANIDLFTRVLGVCGISPRQLHGLGDDEILAIKYSEEFQAFRETYFRLVETATLEHGNFTDELWKRFERMRTRDRMAKRFIRVLKSIELASGALFAAALGSVVQESTTFGQTLMAASGAGAGAGRFLGGLKRLNTTPVDDFVEFATREAYRDRLRASFRLRR